MLENGVVRTPNGISSEAYAQYVEGGWNEIALDEEHGGQGLPQALATAVSEMWSSANTSFALCPTLTMSAVELLIAHGTAEQKRLYLPKLATGEWTGAMNLTEPQAGSDLGALRTRAVPEGDHYRITGQKIFITYGEHDFTPNIVHLVLARLPDAPAGSRGISLFLVPKFLVECRWQPRRAQRSALRQPRAQARHPCEPDLRHVVRRRRRRHRLARRRAASRPRMRCSP